MRHIRELFWISATNNFLMKARHVKGTENTLADALSRLTDPTCATRAETDLEQWIRQNSDVMQIKSGHILDSEASLDTDIQRFRSGVYAESTESTYRSQRRAYLRFCIYHKYVPVPATSKNICRYAVFLARTLKFSSIVGYLNIIRIFHQEAGYENPFQDNWLLQTTLRGIRRHHGDSSQQKLLITPSILRAIHNKLDFSRAYHVVFWAACVVAFFSFFRKSNVLPKTAKDFDATKQLCRRDFRFFDRDRAVEKAFSLADTAEPDGPVFVLPQETGPGFTPLIHKPFVTTLRTLLRQCGYPDSAYSGHSFRRGGATWASECGLPPELIKLQGDWNFSAYQRYTSVSLKGRLWTQCVGDLMAYGRLNGACRHGTCGPGPGVVIRLGGPVARGRVSSFCYPNDQAATASYGSQRSTTGLKGVVASEVGRAEGVQRRGMPPLCSGSRGFAARQLASGRSNFSPLPSACEQVVRVRLADLTVKNPTVCLLYRRVGHETRTLEGSNGKVWPGVLRKGSRGFTASDELPCDELSSAASPVEWSEPPARWTPPPAGVLALDPRRRWTQWLAVHGGHALGALDNLLPAGRPAWPVDQAMHSKATERGVRLILRSHGDKRGRGGGRQLARSQFGRNIVIRVYLTPCLGILDY
ncbi:hypothetical protein Bbelb_361590 [Branchiostoma belcheri]|nr:hypothetical protein Bbelb_361590 [Branchiostoma belcheri]